jgi:hypothetical protein
MADWFETRFREPFEAGQLDPAFVARMRALVVEEWQAEAGATPAEHTGTDDREGDLIMLKTEERPTGDQPRTPRRRSPGPWLLVAAAAVVVAVVGTLLVTAGGDDDDKQIETVTSTPTTLERAEPPASSDEFGTQLDAILEHVPGWAITDHAPTDYDYAFTGPCSGNWGDGATSASDGGLGPAGTGHVGFPTAAQASDAAARFVENLKSCTTTEWRTQPIARTGAVLASSADAVAWIQRTGDSVDVLQVATTDGPPPVSVQVEVAEWMVAYRTWREQN